MDKNTRRQIVIRDLLLFGVAIEALTFYPHSPVVFFCALPIAMASILQLCGILL